MANKIKALNVQVSGNNVYIRDERGNVVEMMNFPQAPMAQSYGNGVSITCGTMCYNYTLDGSDHLVQTGMYAV